MTHTPAPIPLTLLDGRVFIEVVPGILSYLATEFAWKALSTEGKLAVIHATYDRLGVPRP